MTKSFAASSFKLTQSHSSQSEPRDKAMKYLAKSNVDFREQSRKEDARLISLAFDAPNQSKIAEKGARALGVSPRQIIYWMQCENDMPSWAVKAVKAYIRRVENLADQIEGRE